MSTEREQILSFFSKKAAGPLKLKEAGKALNLTGSDYARFRKQVKLLLDEGALVKLSRGRVGVAEKLNVAVGTISITRSGVGFLIRENEEQDVVIPMTSLFTAMDGDEVMVRLTGNQGDRPSGEVIKIVRRTPRKIVGIFRQVRKFNYVEPDNAKIHRDLYIDDDNIGEARDGDKVVAQLLVWDDPHLNPEGVIVERLGRPGETGVDLLAIIKSFNLPEAFPDTVLSEAEQAAARLDSDSSLDMQREDHTAEIVYTIDPADAKDHDDAICVKAVRDGFELAVHIADVAAYVTEGSLLDKEALQRGNSVYLPGMVIPMLPEALSNDVCSLRPDRRRLTQVAIMQIDKSGKLVSWRFADAVIASKAKLSYEQVQAVFDNQPSGEIPEAVREQLLVARKVARLLSERRFADGSLDFDLPEARIVLGEDGEVLDLGAKVRLESHRLIEEFMLLANKAVALEAFRAAVPFIYRVHDKPNMEKLEAFSETMRKLGKPFPVSPTMKPILFSRFLREIADSPEADFINELMLRSMTKAVYQRTNIGHFGLAFSHYTHFTSPIRRYPDLLVHRLLRLLRAGASQATVLGKSGPLIDRVARHCSESERVAEAAERLAIRAKQVSFMAKRLGERFPGVISGVMPYGFFVRLEKLGVEGLVRISSIDDDYYVHDEAQHRILGRRSRKIFRLGDPVQVGILRVDTIRHEIDLFLVGSRADLESRRTTTMSIPRTSKRTTRKRSRR